MITIKPDTAAMAAVVKQLGEYKRGIPVGVQAAISRTITTGVARIARLIGDEVNLSIKRIKESIEAKRGSQRDLRGSIDITRAKRIWLDEFLSSSAMAKIANRKAAIGAAMGEVRNTLAALTDEEDKSANAAYKKAMRKWTKLVESAPVAVKVRKKRTLPQYPVVVAKAFAARDIDGTPRLFMRTSTKRRMKAGRYEGRRRTVIRRLRGPTPLAVFEHAADDSGKTLLQEALADISDILLKNLESQLARFRGGKGA